MNEILALQNDITARKNMSLVGTVQEVMIEGQSEKNAARLSGRTRTNKIVNFDPCPDSRKRIEKSAPGKVVNLKIIRAGLHSLDGRFFTEDGI